MTISDISACEMSLMLNNCFTSDISQYFPYYKCLEINRTSIKL